MTSTPQTEQLTCCQHIRNEMSMDVMTSTPQTEQLTCCQHTRNEMSMDVMTSTPQTEQLTYCQHTRNEMSMDVMTSIPQTEQLTACQYTRNEIIVSMDASTCMFLTYQSTISNCCTCNPQHLHQYVETMLPDMLVCSTEICLHLPATSLMF